MIKFRNLLQSEIWYWIIQTKYTFKDVLLLYFQLVPPFVFVKFGWLLWSWSPQYLPILWLYTKKNGQISIKFYLKKRSNSIKLLNVYNFNFITKLFYKVFYYKYKTCVYNYQISSLIDTNLDLKIRGMVESTVQFPFISFFIFQFHFFPREVLSCLI